MILVAVQFIVHLLPNGLYDYIMNKMSLTYKSAIPIYKFDINNVFKKQKIDLSIWYAPESYSNSRGHIF